jgi:hypothetical protein
MYLDSAGLVAVWREALLAQAVLLGRTRGYRHHPQLARFMGEEDPPSAIAAYLHGVFDEALKRGYRFDASRIGHSDTQATIPATDGQLAFEWGHLMGKLRKRAPDIFRRLEGVLSPKAHPLFRVVTGPLADWERATVP